MSWRKASLFWRFPDGFMTTEASQIFSFDDVKVDPRTGEVFKAGAVVQLEPKAFKLLVFLIENRDHVVEKEEILDALWKDINVTENALASAIAKLRRTLGDDSKTAKYIQTLHTRGYRFVANVEVKNGSATNGHPETAIVEAGAQGAPSLPSTADAATHVRLQNGAQSSPAPRRSLTARNVALAAVICVLLVSATFYSRSFLGRKLSGSAGATTSIAVLPFQSAGSSGDDQVLGFEIADALTSRLSNSSHLSVRSTAAILHYSNLHNDPTAVGRALNVDYILEGNIQRSPGLVTMHLIRVRDAASLQTASFNEKFINIFQVEESLSAQVLRALMVTLDHEEKQRFRRRFTQNAAAYEAFLNAHYFMNLATKDGVNKGIVSFQQAVAIDPNYAMAYAGLGDCYLRLFRFGTAPDEFVPKSRAAVTKAVELDNTVAYAHSMLGNIAFQYDWDFPRAEREYKIAREIDPTLVHQWYAFYLLALNRLAEADVEYRKFDDYLPLLAPASAAYGQYFYLRRQNGNAVDQLNKTLGMQPDFPPAHELLGMVYEQEGRTNEAIAEIQKAIDLSGGMYGLGSLGHVYAWVGRRSEAQKMLRSIAEQSSRTYISPYQLAIVHAGLGKKEKAVDDLERAYAERSLPAPFLRLDPRLNNLRAEPRFQDFARRIGLSF
jgi:DNA-binding winged helix-turn-helix (wHTH) protein/tetratricopeptide (TPR) repeat protein